MDAPNEANRVPRLKLVLVLTENWTMLPGTDLPGLVRMAREAEDSGFDAVMLSEHVVLGPDAVAAGLNRIELFAAFEWHRAARGHPGRPHYFLPFRRLFGIVRNLSLGR